MYTLHNYVHVHVLAQLQPPKSFTKQVHTFIVKKILYDQGEWVLFPRLRPRHEKVAVVEERVIMLLLHLLPTSCPLDSLLSRVPTHRVLDSTGSLQAGKFHLLHAHALLGVRDKIDGVFEGRDY